jgi:ketosteroid isomerase-like protein
MEVTTLNNTTTNADLVRRGYEAFNTADIATLNELFHDDCSWHTPGKSPVAGNYHGKQAVFTQFGRYGGETHGSFRALLKTVAVTEDGTVVGIHRNTGERNGKKLEVDCCIIFRFKDGQLISGTEYFFDLHSWDAFWS